mmetsp:Transcript_25474/g.58790  ORF Transcript_25474/g.58790 Transcript_25474/m.58790 type:complete len:265 (-) Transcript_25474:252-1046(-)|eukprot:CAMPEP_0113303034 /NCGR_PEP_ID=MMETSP0010_2-20120614/3616_1 /TAXON_ID=216773 ORGANISM="Corethron hystrix, Strain 308" /NCGR_SAMPLE_ID=MMETSP0010_2 /ASSEMBLY_ACC=CAM_ASM_000155 /LENGTH=264 /DNA_ID=CAMNT_0000156959 /DNA_START=71 /DNA_END=865 /DNA_ORIENTATION=+ /assembly_acc=CAM_ASM_000155
MIKFYSSWFCPYAQRAWLALEYHGVPFRLIESLEVVGDDYVKNPNLLCINPKGLVPTLEVPSDMLSAQQRDDKRWAVEASTESLPPSSVVVTESIDCVEFIDGLTTENNLIPDESYVTDAHRWNREVSSVFYKVLMKQDAEEQREAFATFVSNVEKFTNFIETGGFYRNLDHPTIVDFTILPWLIRTGIIEHYRPGFILSSSIKNPDICKEFEAYKKRMLDLPYVRATLADTQKLLGVYKRYARGTANSKVGEAVRAGKDAHEI